MAQNFQSLLEEISSQLQPVPPERRYWMVRTQQGTLWAAFRTHGFVALEHSDVEAPMLKQLYQLFKSNEKGLKDYIKGLLSDKHKKDKNVALMAGQIVRFSFGMKAGDIVVIPSEGSSKVSFGEVQSSSIYEATPEEVEKTGCNYVLRKKVKWIEDFGRDRLDPFLYRMFQAHQAINEITQYSEVIERSLKNFFIRGGTGNLILNVETEDHINARQLFGTGFNLLEYVEKFIKDHDIQLDLDQIEVKINLNSPGKIHFKAPKVSTVLLVGLITVGLFGGGLKIDINNFHLDMTTKGLVQKIIDYQNEKHDRKLKDSLWQNLDSLKVKAPDDAVKILQQLSPNKNLPK